ncbi:MAG: hypothetical protein E7254_01885 [Lachnospiraceae bacterium]|nr:hypothetical protein [Lachnospiraceae bacterium]
MKKIIGSIAVFSMILGLSVVGLSNTSNAEVRFKLKKDMPWANSDYKKCIQSSGAGEVYSTSLKKVAWVLEYRGSDGQWHYQKPVKNWPRFNPGTTVPIQTGYIYNKCDQRLQLNPYGEGDNGLGGHALGIFYVIQ